MGMPNTVMPEEIAQLTGLSQHEAAAMLQHYASKVVDEHGASKLTEKDPKLRFPDDHGFAGHESHRADI